MEPKTQKTTPASKNPLQQLEDFLDLYLGQKAPALPENFKQSIVKFAPGIIILGLVLTVPPIFAFFGFGALLAPVSLLGGPRYATTLSFAIIMTMINLVLEVIALPGLFKRTAKGWKIIYYATLISGISFLAHANIGSLILSTGISLYVLFQIKKYYTN